MNIQTSFFGDLQGRLCKPPFLHQGVIIIEKKGKFYLGKQYEEDLTQEQLEAAEKHVQSLCQKLLPEVSPLIRVIAWTPSLSNEKTLERVSTNS